MSVSKPNRPAFQSVEIDLIDQRLDAQAAEKGIPTLVTPKSEPADIAEPASAMPAPKAVPEKASRAPDTVQGTPRAKMNTLNIEVPDYAWIAIKIRAAQQKASMRYIVMLALRADGIEIKDIDLIEDGRRLRGSEAV